MTSIHEIISTDKFNASEYLIFSSAYVFLLGCISSLHWQLKCKAVNMELFIKSIKEIEFYLVF